MSMQPYEQPAAMERYIPAPPVSDRTVDLAKWAYEARAVHGMAEALARTSFVPAPMRGKPDEIAAQILYGQDVKLPPMVALQQIHVIDGRPSMSALSMRGMAQANGVKFKYVEMTETRCKMAALAPGDTDWTQVSWTIDRAKKLELTSKKNWQRQPQAMLIARATSELCRLVAAPLFLGMAYSTEELRDGGDDIDVPFEPAEAAEPKPSRVFRRDPVKPAKPEPPAQPPAEPPPAEPVGYSTEDDARKTPEQPAEPEQRMIIAATRKQVMDAFKAAQIDSMQMRGSYVSDIVGREVHSLNQITEAEAQKVLAALTAPDDGWPDPQQSPS